MADTTSGQVVPKTDAEPEIDLEQLLREMQHLQDRMDKDQADIEQLRAENRALSAETRAMLTLLKATLQTC